jgi:phosphoribosylamine---glycine ligase
MKVFVVGGGGREHALVWKFSREGGVSSVACAPGNAGTEKIARSVPIAASDTAALFEFARREQIDLTVVGPELPLDLGIVDLFASAGLPIFGPRRGAARLESSKVFAKQFMARHGVPTARFRVCDNPASAHAIVASGELGFPVVIKADGLAAGKGVVVAENRAAATDAVRGAMEERQFGDAGSRIVIEECLHGHEASFFVLCDGTRALPLLSAQDHKRIFDDDRGPNTGGMGAFSPSPLVDAALESRILREIVEPVMTGLRAEGQEYRGFLYVGLMITCDGPKVIEFNVRFGDPEAQVVLPAILDDVAPALAAAAEGALPDRRVTFSGDKHVGVVLASEGYPGAGRTGVTIEGLDSAAALEDVIVFHSGTARRDSAVVTAGGRVLTVVGRGPTYEQAIARAYEAVSKISFEGMQYRRDIGRKAVLVS